jgi:hypothetical protein
MIAATVSKEETDLLLWPSQTPKLRNNPRRGSKVVKKRTPL